jgi:hypothetical protein
VNGRIATSVYGTARFENFADGKRRAHNFVLESLDFAPPERAALKLGGDFFVTAEMEQADFDVGDIRQGGPMLM